MRALVLALVLAAASPAAASASELPGTSQPARFTYTPSGVDGTPHLRARDSRPAIRRASKGTHVPRMGTDEPPSR